MGKNFPIKAKDVDTIVLVLIIAFVAYWVRRTIKFVQNEIRCDKQLARIEARRLKRERLRSGRGPKRPPKYEVVDGEPS